MSEERQRRPQALFQRASELIQVRTRPQKVILWIVLLLALLGVAGFSMTKWKQDRDAGLHACLCSPSMVELCDPSSGQRTAVPARCDCPEEPDALSLRHAGWVDCKD
jgi:hypothetical protein